MRTGRWLAVVWDSPTEWLGPFEHENEAQACFDDDSGLSRCGLIVKVMIDETPTGLRFAGVESKGS